MHPPITESAEQLVDWYQDLWYDVTELTARYGLTVRTEWWTGPLHVEALAAFAAWVARYDSGEWDDPPGKLALLYDVERLNTLLRDGNDPFHPDQHQQAFDDFCAALLADHHGTENPTDNSVDDIPEEVAAMNPDQIRREAERIIGEDYVSTDILREIVANHYRTIL